jgi:DNA-binding winged helix-turn-helix (wHTH) protein/tetratricopeptide (TPR) repeat protein
MDGAPEIHFDGWTLKRASGELLRGGSTIQLQPQPLQVLEELLAHPGEVVTRDHLTARLWPTGIVDFDTALNSAVRRLRKTLGDDPDEPRYIQTIPRKGYRFIGSIDNPTELAQPAAARIVPQPESIAADRPPVDPPATRNLQLALTACALVAMVGLSLVGDSGEPQANTTHTAPTPARNAAAIDRPLEVSDSAVSERLRRARYFLERRSPGDLERARQYFEQAAGLDPTRAEAYAGLASVYWLESMEGEIAREIGLTKVKTAALRALSLDPHEAEAHFRFALYSRNIGDNAAANDHIRRAHESDPYNPMLLALGAGDALIEGHFDEAVQLWQRAVTAAPLNLSFRYNLASALYLTGRFEEALQVMQELLEMDAHYRALPLANIWILRGRYQDAARLAEGWADGPDKWQSLALAYFGMGATTESDRALATLIREAGTAEPLRIVEVYAYRHDVDRALEWLKGVTVESYRTGGGRTPGLSPSLIRLSPFVTSLRGDPRWERWLASLSLPN